MYLDPTAIRLSECTLLSDFMGCDTVYRSGVRNRFPDAAKLLARGRALGKLIDEAAYSVGRGKPESFSVSYGYISPELSRECVSYQDPDKPSYHRWDIGAAADVCFHSALEFRAPMELVLDIHDSKLEYDRLITYSESPWMCLAVAHEDNKPAYKLYENRRVEGTRKPNYIRYPALGNRRDTMLNSLPDYTGWEGRGYPSYHGGGRLQLHHVRVGRHNVLSDFLYCREKVHRGAHNMPRTNDYTLFEVAANIISEIIDNTDIIRVSVVAAYDGPDWYHNPTISIVPHGGTVETIVEIVGEKHKTNVIHMKSGVSRAVIHLID